MKRRVLLALALAGAFPCHAGTVSGITGTLDVTPVCATGGTVCASGGGSGTVTSANLSGTIAAGGTFQSFLTAGAGSRKGCALYNTNATEVLYVYVGSGTPSTSNSLPIPAGWGWTCNTSGVVEQSAVSIMAATTGHTFVAWAQ